jgi:hypothetical protein
MGRLNGSAARRHAASQYQKIGSNLYIFKISH